MSDFKLVTGFEELWRPSARSNRQIRQPALAASHNGASDNIRARLVRVVRGAPEVIVKVVGRTRNARQLHAHLSYISRGGVLEMEDREGAVLSGRDDLRELAEDWSATALMDRHARTETPISRAIVLSAPPGVEATAVREATRAFARERLAERFEYVFVVHTDTAIAHAHLTARHLGRDACRLNLKKADIPVWRETWAQALRDQGIAAEATSRAARGMTRKPEGSVLRRIAAQHAAGRGEIARTLASAYQQAARAAFLGDTAPKPWEAAMVHRQSKVRALYLAQAKLLQASIRPDDRVLGAEVEAFVRSMPAPDSLRLALAREMRAANETLRSRRRERDDNR